MLRTEYVRPLHELLAGHAVERPERIAFVDDVRAVTYGGLAATTARLAGHLQRLGLEAGDRVLLHLDNRGRPGRSCRRRSTNGSRTCSAFRCWTATGSPRRPRWSR